MNRNEQIIFKKFVILILYHLTIWLAFSDVVNIIFMCVFNELPITCMLPKYLYASKQYVLGVLQLYDSQVSSIMCITCYKRLDKTRWKKKLSIIQFITMWI